MSRKTRHYEYEDHDYHEDRICPICNGYIGFLHKCDPKVLDAIDSGQKRGSVELWLDSPPEDRRLTDGFAILDSCEDDPADSEEDDEEGCGWACPEDGMDDDPFADPDVEILFPATSFTPLSNCVHPIPLPDGAMQYCPMCHQTGIEDDPAVRLMGDEHETVPDCEEPKRRKRDRIPSGKSRLPSESKPKKAPHAEPLEIDE